MKTPRRKVSVKNIAVCPVCGLLHSDAKRVGSQLRRIRLTSGSGLKRIAMLVHRSVQLVSRVERGEIWPSNQMLIAYSQLNNNRGTAA